MPRATPGWRTPSIDTLATAYAKGGHGPVPNATESARWQTRATELRKQRAGMPAYPGQLRDREILAIVALLSIFRRTLPAA